MVPALWSEWRRDAKVFCTQVRRKVSILAKFFAVNVFQPENLLRVHLLRHADIGYLWVHLLRNQFQEGIKHWKVFCKPWLVFCKHWIVFCSRQVRTVLASNGGLLQETQLYPWYYLRNYVHDCLRKYGDDPIWTRHTMVTQSP